MGRFVLEATDLSKVYPGPPPVTALTSVTIAVAPGERVAVIGPSGAGKSTLLNLLGLLDTPTTGRVVVAGSDSSTLGYRDRDHLRANAIGFVFQESHVLGHRTVRENLEIALVARGTAPDLRDGMCSEVLQRVGLQHRCNALGRLLSGGERQRLALARAIVTSPRIILADEPTGNLDPDNTQRILALLDEQVSRGVSVLVITHDPGVAKWADRVCELRHGEGFNPGQGMVRADAN